MTPLRFLTIAAAAASFSVLGFAQTPAHRAAHHPGAAASAPMAGMGCMGGMQGGHGHGAMSGDMSAHHAAMEQRMEAMQAMMKTMMDRMAPAPTKP